MSKLIAAAVLLGSFTGSAILFSAGCASHGQDDEPGSATLFAVTDAGPPAKGSLLISEVYGSGGLTGAARRNDYVELFNKTTKDIELDGLSLQMSTSATNNFTVVVKLTGTIKASSFFLVELASSGPGGDALTDPNQSEDVQVLAKDGKIALVPNITPLNCGGNAPVNLCTAAKYLDLVGWGATSQAGGGNGLPAIDDTKKAAVRKDPCVDTGDNAKDFAVGDTDPQNAGSPVKVCPVPQKDAGPDSGPKEAAAPIVDPDLPPESPYDGGYRPEAGPSVQASGGGDDCAVGNVGGPSGFSLFAPLAGLGLAAIAIGRRRKK